MTRFFGLQLAHRPLTDGEYIERLRKKLRQGRRYGRWLFWAAVAFTVAVAVLFYFFARLLLALAGLFGGMQMTAQGFLLGVLAGAVLLHTGRTIVFQFVNTMHQMLGSDRTAELLVQYHDLLANIIQSDDSATARASESRAGEGRAGGRMNDGG